MCITNLHAIIFACRNIGRDGIHKPKNGSDAKRQLSRNNKSNFQQLPCQRYRFSRERYCVEIKQISGARGDKFAFCRKWVTMRSSLRNVTGYVFVYHFSSDNQSL